jgi:hypothetical protein
MGISPWRTHGFSLFNSLCLEIPRFWRDDLWASKPIGMGEWITQDVKMWINWRCRLGKLIRNVERSQGTRGFNRKKWDVRWCECGLKEQLGFRPPLHDMDFYQFYQNSGCWITLWLPGLVMSKQMMTPGLNE